MGFKEEHTEKERKQESSKVLNKYPNRIPIICERNNSGVIDIDKNKFLVPSDLTISQFAYVIRKRIQVKPETAIFIMINNTIAVSTQMIKDVYKQYKDPDGFLYMTYSNENVFG